MFSFQFESGLKKVPIDIIGSNEFEKISESDFDFDEAEELIKEEMNKKDIKNEIEKIMFSLQKHEGKDFLICTVFISRMGILKANIDIQANKVVEFEKKSFFDLIKIGK